MTVSLLIYAGFLKRHVGKGLALGERRASVYSLDTRLLKRRFPIRGASERTDRIRGIHNLDGSSGASQVRWVRRGLFCGFLW
jgi:hypothetical protein